MAGECAQGVFGRMLVKAGSSPYDWGTGASRLAFYREKLQRIGRIDHPDVITGDLYEHSERARRGPNTYYGPITLPVSPGDLQILLPAITGGTFSGTTIGMGATRSAYGFLLDKMTEVFEYQNAVVDRAVIYGRQNADEDPSSQSEEPNYLIMQLFLVARLEQEGVAFPGGTSLVANAEYTPFTVEDCTVELAGSERETKEFVIDINNHIKQRRVNNLDPTALCPSRCTINVLTTHPYFVATADLYDQALAGAAGSITVENGTIGTMFTFPTLQVPPRTPFIAGKTEIDLTLHHVARMVGTDGPMEVVNDATP